MAINSPMAGGVGSEKLTSRMMPRRWTTAVNPQLQRGDQSIGQISAVDFGRRCLAAYWPPVGSLDCRSSANRGQCSRGVSKCVFAPIHDSYAHNANFGKGALGNRHEWPLAGGHFPGWRCRLGQCGHCLVRRRQSTRHLGHSCAPTATVGASGKVTVFTKNDWRGSGAIHLDSWWDQAELVILGAQPPRSQRLNLSRRLRLKLNRSRRLPFNLSRAVE